MIPTYNQQEYIGQAIESALMQDYPNLEVIVADDCSTDRTGEIARQYTDPRLKYVRNEPNLGRVGNYQNSLYHHATGQWVINLDGDDYYTDPSFISSAMANVHRAMQQDDTQIVAYLFRHDNLASIRKNYSCRELSDCCIRISGKTYFYNYHRIGHFSHMSTLYRRDVALSIGMYTMPFQASDFHAIIRMTLLGDILLDSRRIGIWRVHGNNTTIKEVGRKQEQARQTFDAIETFARDYFSPEELRSWRKGMDQAAFYDYASTYIHCQRDWTAIKLLFQSFRPDYNYLRLVAYFILNR